MSRFYLIVSRTRLVGRLLELRCLGKSVHFDLERRQATTAVDFPRRSSLTLCLLIMMLPFAAAHAQPKNTEIWFDIPSQPLASALDAFSVASGIVAIYNGNLAVGRRSGEVRGRLTPEAALSLLLQDSGLLAQYTTSDAFVVLPAPQQTGLAKTPSTIAAAALSQQNPTEQRYSGLLQASIIQFLCAQPQTRPGTYRLAISFRVGSSSEVTQLKLLGSTGDRQRDLAIADVVGHVSIGEPPPPRMAQPFTMVLLPRSSGGDAACPPNQSGGPHG